MTKKYFTIILAGQKNIIVLLMVMGIYSFTASFKKNNHTNLCPAGMLINETDSLVSKKAFLEVYKVLMSPRCMNCHPSGDVPLVGEDSHLHGQRVKRGEDGRGMYASKCANCHMDKNTPGLNKPPGNPDWHMPPANMKMIFQGRAARELAAQLLDTAENGNKTIEDLKNYIANNGLVAGAWNPGEGRNPPPLSYEEFTKQFRLWIDNGAFLPDR
ncbi:MAG: hypothetical protein Q8941_06765 [Bacteroidota bacterium]|nr:hypothetical protein [Bacteroidota bacterium]